MDTRLLYDRARQYHQDETTGHDFAHVARVAAHAAKILAETPQADADIVTAAALLHDVADHKLVTAEQRPGVLAAMRAWLDEAGATPAQAEKILHICANLSFSTSAANAPLPLEGLIVQDADRLDAIGAVGIARAFAYGGAHGRPLYQKGSADDTISHFYQKLLLLKDRMNTPAGRRLAEQRHRFTETFLRQFFDECE